MLQIIIKNGIIKTLRLWDSIKVQRTCILLIYFPQLFFAGKTVFPKQSAHDFSFRGHPLVRGIFSAVIWQFCLKIILWRYFYELSELRSAY